MFAFNYSKLNKNLHFFVMLSLRQRKSHIGKMTECNSWKKIRRQRAVYGAKKEVSLI